MKQRYKLDILLYAMIILGLAGFFLVASVNATETHHHEPLNLSVPEMDCGTAGAMAAGQHNFYITSRKQMSVSGAFRGECSAASIGTAFTHNQTLYSGQVTYEEGGELSGGIAATITFN